MSFLDFLGNRLRNGEEVPVSDTVIAEAAATAYFKACALSTAISYKANALAMSNIKVYEHGEEVKNELWYMLNYSPNPNQCASQFWNKFIEQLALTGEALVVPMSKGIYVADSFCQRPEHLRNNVFEGVTVEGQSLRKTFRANRCYYVSMSADKTSAVSDALDAYATMMGYAMREYKRSRGSKFKVVMERRATGDANAEKMQRDMLAQNLKTFMENANAVYMETAGQRLEPVKTDSRVETDDVTKLRKEIYETAAVSLKIPKSVLYGDMTNIGDIVNVMLTFAVDPEARMIAQEITRKEYTPEEILGGCRVAVDTSTVKHTDLFDIAPDAMNLVSSGVMTIDDLLVSLGKEPVGDQYTSQRWMTKNIGRIEDVLEPESGEGGEQNG